MTQRTRRALAFREQDVGRAGAEHSPDSRVIRVHLGGRQVLAAEILGGHQVGIRIDGETLSFFDSSSRELLPDGDGGGVDAEVFNCWDR